MDDISTGCKKSPIPQCTLLLTVNQRLSMEINRSPRRAIGTESPFQRAMPLTAWVKSTWSAHAIDKILLSTLEEKTLWHQLITDDEEITLLNPMQTAKLAQQAWATLHYWKINPLEIPSSSNHDITIFSRWAEAFAIKCQNENFITEPEIYREVENMITQGYLCHLPSCIHILGYDEYSPATKSLIDALSQKTLVKHSESKSNNSKLSKISFSTVDEELRAAIDWGLKESQSPDAKRVAIIVPNLSEKKHTISRLLQNIPTKHYNISAGKKLIEYEIIKAALSMLSLLNSNLEVEESAFWLQTPYLTMKEIDFVHGAILNKRLRKLEKRQLPLSVIFKLFANLPQSSEGSWLQRLREINKLIVKQTTCRAMHETIDTWIECLKTAGWPGIRTLSSLDHQLVNKFNTLLNQLQSLSKIKSMIPPKEALVILRQLCEETEFQPEGSSAKLQILGILESAGMQFESAWITSLDNETLPPQAKPNPFIPLSLQVKNMMPHASPAKELEFSRRVLTRLLNSAENVTLSFATCKDNKSMVSTSLIENDCWDKVTTVADNLNGVLFHATAPVEEHNDHFAPALLPSEKQLGGSRLIELQANCPFRAFAELRLNARPLAQPVTGISAAQKGAFIHRALEEIWNKLKNHSTLISSSQSELDSLINESIERVVKSDLYRDIDSKGTIWLQLEKKRIFRIIKDWLENEKLREDFSVLGHEIEQKININQLTLNVKIDRVDQCSDGKTLIIDYKTGATSTASWLGDRPTSPQLPLYCVFNDLEQHPSGIAYGSLKASALTFAGICSDDLSVGTSGITPISKVRTSSLKTWPDTVTHWKTAIEKLSDEFCSGDARVEPISKLACQYCHLENLCRIKK